MPLYDEKIGFSGGCHWCTEAVFESLTGIQQVEQGYISENSTPDLFYEGVLVYFDINLIDVKDLIEIHLHTHQSTSNHSMRSKYVSGIYTFNTAQYTSASTALNELEASFDEQIITKVFHFGRFKISRPEIRSYYKTDPERPFCKIYIDPKLKLLREKFQHLTS